MISISELAKMFNVTVRTIRYYEQIGLIESSKRLKGKRYFTRENTIETLKRIKFLKSLGLPLSDVKIGLKSPFYNKLLMANIRLNIVQNNIKRLVIEADKLKDFLDGHDWKVILIEENNILENMKESYSELYELEKKLMNCEGMSLEEIDSFVDAYIKWHKKNGINITFEHLCTVTSNLSITYEEKKLIKIFEKYINSKGE